MFSDVLPELLNANRFIDAQEAGSAVLEARHFARFAEAATLQAGGQITLTGRRDPYGPRVIEGHLTCDATVTCQRCLQPMVVELSGEICWGLVFAESEMESLDKAYDPILVMEGQIRLREAVEDELMLLLPMMPMHSACDSGWKPDETVSQTERESPFAVLSKLKNDKGS